MLLSSLIYVSALFIPLAFADSDLPNGLDGPYGPIDRTLPPAQYYYPQPKLPSKKAVNDPQSFRLSKDFVITDKPRTREYFWNIDCAQAAPDGYPRQIYAVNGRFPGPLIEANEGDTIIVHVRNSLRIPQSIHWHGMFQNGTNYMDGVPGVSQFPIPPFGSYTYKFKLDNQFGSFWWHSHQHNTMIDGLVGGLIVHSKRDLLKRGVDFDEEMVVLVSDWMDLQSASIVQAFRTAHGYKGSNAPPHPNAGLINGKGVTNCSNEDIQDRSLPCSPPAPYEIKVPIGKKIKMRIINTGADAMWRFSVDQHTLNVVELDDTLVDGPKNIHEVPINVAQRTSVIFSTDVAGAKAGDSFWIRSQQVIACIGRAPDLEALAVLRYVDDKGKSPSSQVPSTQPWSDLQRGNAQCQDLDREHTISPTLPADFDVPTNNIQTQVLNSKSGVFVDWEGTPFSGFGINNITATLHTGYPLFQQIKDRHTIDPKYMASVNFNQVGTADLIINNLDTFIAHPFHLHGKKFIIAARGSGSITADQWIAMRDTVAVKQYPLKRDVITIGKGEYAVLRFSTDVPGVFPVHCHIGWHVSLGKFAAVVIRPDQIRKQNPPLDWSLNCLLTRKNEKDKFARRDIDSFASDIKGGVSRVMRRLWDGHLGR